MVELRTNHEIELLNACKEGRSDAVKGLLNLNLIKWNDNRYFDYFLITKALDNRHCNLANLLIQKGFRVYKKPKTNQERTVLHIVVQSGYHELLETLLRKGASADILSFDERNKTPFHLAIDKNELSIISEFLNQLPAKAFDEKYLLHYAIEKNNIKVVSQFVAHGLSPRKKNDKNLTPFCTALRNENYKIVDVLLSFCSVKKIKTSNYNNVAPAYFASICGNTELIKKYIDSGLPIDISHKVTIKSWSSLNKYSGFTLLHFAVKHVKLKMVKLLLRLGADILIENESGSTPLQIAFEAKEIGVWNTWKDFDNNNLIIDKILKTNKKLKSNPINKHGLSHFHIACSRDEPKIVEHFLSFGASINQPVKLQCPHYKKFSPLHFAAKFRCKKTMEILLKNGANVKQKDSQNMTALHIAVRESSHDIVELVLEYGADVASTDSHGKTPVHWAFENQSFKILDLLLSVPNFDKTNPTNSIGVSHFHIACTRNKEEVVKSFIIKRKTIVDICVPTRSNVDQNTVDGYSPLHFAVSHNRTKIVKLLLDSGANVGLKSCEGLTPLHLACGYSDGIFGEFIENILNMSIKQGKVTQHIKPLTDIARVSEVYFNGLKGSIRKIDWSSNRMEHMNIINLLLDYGSDVNCIDNIGHTPVYYAYAVVIEVKNLIFNHSSCSKKLWSQIIEDFSEELYKRRKLILVGLLKLDVNLDNCCGNISILHDVVTNHQKDKKSDEMLELFLKKGADANATDENWTALHLATFKEYKTHMNLLLEYGANVDCINPKNNKTPLLLVTGRSRPLLYDTEVVKILLEKGADPNAKKTNGRTALHNLASRLKSHFYDYMIGSILPTLVKAGADINSRDSKGLTPLHLACRKKKDSVDDFLSYGANVNVEDNRGRSVCCYLFESYTQNTLNERDGNDIKFVMHYLSRHIIKMNIIGLPVSEKVLSSHSKCMTIANRDMGKFIESCEREVQVLRDTPIYGSCSLFDVILKNENTLSHLVKIRKFKNIVLSRSFDKKYDNYGYLIQLKYQAGVDRGKLLPEAKCVLNNLAGLHLPDTCSENICEYFTNAELRESIGILRGVLDLKMESSDEIQLRNRRAHKRQKVN